MLADMLADSARRRPEDWLNDQQSHDAMLHFLGGFAERLTPHPEVILHMLADVTRSQRTSEVTETATLTLCT